MAKSRILALICAVSILMTMFVPVALGDEAADADVVETVISQSIDGTDTPMAIDEPTGGDSSGDAPMDAHTPSLPDKLQVFNDCGSAIWQGGSLTFTVNVTLADNAVLCAYDSTNISGTAADISQYFVAGTPQYLYQAGISSAVGNTLYYNDVNGTKLWQLTGFSPSSSGMYNYSWRLYATDSEGRLLNKDGGFANGLADAYYKDYTPGEGSSVTVYAAPTAPQISSLSPNTSASAGTTISMTVTTSAIIDDVQLTDENGYALGYVQSSSCSTEGSSKRWSFAFTFYDEGAHRFKAVASATIGGTTKTADSDVRSIMITRSPSDPTQPPATPMPSGVTPAPTAEPTMSPDGEVRIANVPSANTTTGMPVSFNLDLEYVDIDGNKIKYTADEFYKYVEYVEVSPDINADFPFTLDSTATYHKTVRSASDARQNPMSFSFRTRSDLQNGNYSFSFTVRYKLKGHDTYEPEKSYTGFLFIFGADTTPAPSDDGSESLGYVRVIQIPSISARAGDTVDVDMGVEFAASDGKRYSYTSADFYRYVDYIEISPVIDDSFPFVADGNINRKIVRSLTEAAANPFTYRLTIKKSLETGTHTFSFNIKYRLKGSSGSAVDKTESCLLFVTDAAEPTANPQAGYVRFIQMPNESAKVGQSLTLDLGVEFASADGQRYAYTDPEFYNYVDYIENQPEITDSYPFVVDDSLSRKIIRSLEDARTNPFTYDVTVKKSLTNGAYTVNFTLKYRLKGNAAPEDDKTEAGMIIVSGASSGSSGGGGGGGSSLPDSQAKLIVESLSTDPENPQAGDTFDINLSLKNTNEKYIKNIKVSYTVDNDALLPANGSSTFYIDKIDADETYELTIPVTARTDMADAPVKMNLTMEYEDKKVNSVTASQVVVLDVKQVQKLKLDTLVVPQGEIYVGDKAAFSLNVINAGRTTLYNVSVAMAESDMFYAAGSSYLGNLETGNSKKAELTIYPNQEGMIDGTVRVTYEDANGNQTYEDVPFEIYAMSETSDDDYNYEPEIEPTPEPTFEMTTILSKLPWWVYGAAGMFVICMVALAAIAVHRKKASAMLDYDDE